MMVQPIKIYVGNVPTSARNSELKELFEKFGKVVECDILKEFGFVHMEDTNDAKAAIAGLNDTLWKGARIRVELSTTKTNKGEPSKRESFKGGDRRGDRRSANGRGGGGRGGRGGGGGDRGGDRRRHNSVGNNSMPRNGGPPPQMMRDSYNGGGGGPMRGGGGMMRGGGGGGPMRENRYGNQQNGRGRPYPDAGGRPFMPDRNRPYSDNFDKGRGGSNGYDGGMPPPPQAPLHRGFNGNGNMGSDYMRPPMNQGPSPSAMQNDFGPRGGPPMGGFNNMNNFGNNNGAGDPFMRGGGQPPMHHQGHHQPMPPMHNDYFRGPPLPPGPPPASHGLPGQPQR